MNNFFLDKEFIFQNTDFKNQDELFKNIGKKLIDKNYVCKDYIHEILKREKKFPTGISTKNYEIALPHIDSKFVNVNTMFLIKSEKGIEFEDAESDRTLKAKIIFGLIIKDHDSHIKLLMKISNLVQDTSLLDKIYFSNNKQEVLNILAQKLEIM